jgi:hypothetical protein
MVIALFGITDSSLNLVVNLLILVLVVIWIALVWWTNADARRRIDDPVLVATATATSLFPFIGTIIYTILRPPEYLADARERELETKAAELRLRRLTETSCARCEHPIELSWLRCPECQHRLKDPCRSCGRPVDPRWSVCPYCEASVGGAPKPESGRPKKGPSRTRAGQPASRQRSSGERAGAAPAARQPKRRAPATAGSGSAPPPRQKAAPERKQQQAPRTGNEPEQTASRQATPKS